MTEENKIDLMKKAIQGFPEYCGLEAVSMEEGLFVTRIRLLGHHLQQDGFAHAGLIAMMADHTSGYAAYTLVPPGMCILTVEYKINYLKAASGEYLECHGRVIKPGKSLLVCESEVFALRGGEKYLAAKSILTMASVPGEKVPKSL